MSVLRRPSTATRSTRAAVAPAIRRIFRRSGGGVGRLGLRKSNSSPAGSVAPRANPMLENPPATAAASEESRPDERARVTGGTLKPSRVSSEAERASSRPVPPRIKADSGSVRPGVPPNAWRVRTTSIVAVRIHCSGSVSLEEGMGRPRLKSRERPSRISMPTSSDLMATSARGPV